MAKELGLLAVWPEISILGGEVTRARKILKLLVSGWEAVCFGWNRS